MTIYFVQAGDDGPVKIGFSQNVPLRLSKMRADSPTPLRLLGEMLGNQAEEAALHRRFADHRQRGEWFSPHPDILAIAATCPPAPPRRRRFANGNGLADYLDAHGLSLEVFAKQIDRSAATVSRIARGKHRPDWPTMDAIAKATAGSVTSSDFHIERPTAPAPKGQQSAA